MYIRVYRGRANTCIHTLYQLSRIYYRILAILSRKYVRRRYIFIERVLMLLIDRLLPNSTRSAFTDYELYRHNDDVMPWESLRHHWPFVQGFDVCSAAHNNTHMTSY